MTDELAELETLSQEAHTKQTSAARARLGHRKVSLGFASDGLRDLLVATGLLQRDQAYVAGKLENALEILVKTNALEAVANDSDLLAKLGEALRVYARDVQLSRAEDRLLDKTVTASIACFDKAIGLLPEGTKARRAWLLAHRGAARMMIYWLGLTLTPDAKGDDAQFEACKKDFLEASELRKPSPYTWSIQFNAFLHALRGGPGDFDVALALLGSLDKATLAKPTIQRSIAMLYSYNASPTSGKDQPERQAAARLSLAAAFNPQRDDQDEFLAPYSGAVSSWTLFDMAVGASPEEKQRLLRAAQASCETAEIRARNAISQALVALAGLTFVRGKIAAASGDKPGLEAAAAESEALQRLISESSFRDLESRAMVIRDPVWQAIKNDGACAAYFCRPGFDELRKFARSSAVHTAL